MIVLKGKAQPLEEVIKLIQKHTELQTFSC